MHQKGGTINGERGKGDTAAFIDNQLVNDSSRQSHPCTAKKVDCDILCHDPRYNLRCKSCQFLRCTLTSLVIRVTSVDECTSSTSHTSQRNLSPAEKDTWLKNLQHSLRIVKQQVHRLKAKTGQHIENEGVSLEDDNGTDMSDIFAECSTPIDKRQPTESPQQIFGEE